MRISKQPFAPYDFSRLQRPDLARISYSVELPEAAIRGLATQSNFVKQEASDT